MRNSKFTKELAITGKNGTIRGVINVTMNHSVMELAKTGDLSPKIKEMLLAEGSDINIGDIFIDYHGENIFRINKIERRHNQYFERNKDDADYVKQHPKYSIHIHMDRAKDWEATEWSSYGSDYRINDFKIGGKYKKLTKSVAEYRQEALDVIEGKISIDELSIKETESDNQNTSLISKSSKEGLIAIQKDMQLKKDRVEMIKGFVSYEMERRKQELDNIRQKLEGVLIAFKKQIKRIMRVIATIELYLGIDEEIVQIQEGEKAPIDTPITFRQRVLYMDEEIANTDDGGFDFRDVSKFDGWLLENGNYKKLFPELKGMLIFRPRRNDKYYSDDSKENREINELNKETYLFIRNGDCLYRIYTKKIMIYPRLFPQRTELMDLLNEIKKAEYERAKDEAKDKVETLTDQYQKRAVLMQGLIDRTDILHPLPKEVSIFKMEEAEGMFNFIYDDDMALPDGKLSFWEWHRMINKKIQRGSRVCVVEMGNRSGRYTPAKEYKDRLFYYCSDYNVPSLPITALYEIDSKFSKKKDKLPHYTVDELQDKGYLIEKGKEVKNHYGSGYVGYINSKFLPNIGVKVNTYKGTDTFDREETYYIETYECTYNEEQLFIRYNPKDEVYGGWGNYDPHTRKNRVSWKVYQHDSFVLNYDQISLDDIEFYLHNRADRENYLEMMPLLRTLKKWRLSELENEKYFAMLVIQQVTSVTIKKPISDLESKVWKAIEWWKFKNQFKRPIDKDDAKALRMIQKKIIKEN